MFDLWLLSTRTLESSSGSVVLVPSTRKFGVMFSPSSDYRIELVSPSYDFFSLEKEGNGKVG